MHRMNSTIHVTLAFVCLRLGKFSEAICYTNQSIEKYPDHGYNYFANLYKASVSKKTDDYRVLRRKLLWNLMRWQKLVQCLKKQYRTLKMLWNGWISIHGVEIRWMSLVRGLCNKQKFLRAQIWQQVLFLISIIEDWFFISVLCWWRLQSRERAACKSARSNSPRTYFSENVAASCLHFAPKRRPTKSAEYFEDWKHPFI